MKNRIKKIIFLFYSKNEMWINPKTAKRINLELKYIGTKAQFFQKLFLASR